MDMLDRRRIIMIEIIEQLGGSIIMSMVGYGVIECFRSALLMM